jgi:hypothetical protein
MNKVIINRILPNVKKMPSGCWEWQGHSPVKSGYGRISIKGRRVLVHRLMMGEPDGHVLHKCDNTKCVNPEHLYVGTHADNMRDKKERGRCPDMKGEKNPSAGMTEEQAQNVVNLLHQGVRQCTIIRETGLSQTQVNYIARGRTWNHLQPKTPQMTASEQA